MKKIIMLVSFLFALCIIFFVLPESCSFRMEGFLLCTFTVGWYLTSISLVKNETTIYVERLLTVTYGLIVLAIIICIFIKLYIKVDANFWISFLGGYSAFSGMIVTTLITAFLSEKNSDFHKMEFKRINTYDIQPVFMCCLNDGETLSIKNIGGCVVRNVNVFAKIYPVLQMNGGLVEISLLEKNVYEKDFPKYQKLNKDRKIKEFEICYVDMDFNKWKQVFMIDYEKGCIFKEVISIEKNI